MLYRRAVKPVSRIQSIVREYKNNKDSDEVIARMSEIKERNEFGLLSEDIAELAKEIDYYTKQNMKLAGERERVAAELDMARRLQASQLPTQMPAFPDRQDIDVFASMTPAKEVGGDFYDYFLIDDDHLAIVVADVSGKGIPAALFMMMTKMLLTDNAMTGMPPHEVLERTNDTICKHNELEMFVTMWFGVLEISTGRITAANAGHEYPVVRHKDGQFEVLKDTHDFIVGGMEGMAYRQYELELEKGSMLFLYTDGAPEATRADKQMFGMKRLVDALNENPNDTPQVLLERVRARIDEFVGDEPQFDDLTMLGITIL
jgi:serine phosphatase RsbU (regulator of sigma subunit)